jgi:triosephosphate isomerase
VVDGDVPGVHSNKKIVVGNWKMNGDCSLVDEFVDVFHELTIQKCARIGVLCVPYTLIACATQRLSQFVLIGAQNCSSFGPSRAYTGQVSCEMLIEAGATHVIIGHSECRGDSECCSPHEQSDPNDVIAQKLSRAVASGLIPIVCVGGRERDPAAIRETLARQLVPLLDLQHAHIAYEPVWAIGTGVVPTLDEITDAHKFIYDTCGCVPLYGGSVTVNNCDAILGLDNVSGVLVGRESVNARKFLTMLTNTKNDTIQR